MLPMPINLLGWIEENRHLLKPPVGNKMIENGDFIVMVVGGPNSRTDYHYDEGPEWFYQLEGEMVLKVQEDGAVRDIPIRAGEIFLLPGKVPHSPRRPPGGVAWWWSASGWRTNATDCCGSASAATTSCTKSTSPWKTSKPTCRRCLRGTRHRWRCARARRAGMWTRCRVLLRWKAEA